MQWLKEIQWSYTEQHAMLLWPWYWCLTDRLSICRPNFCLESYSALWWRVRWMWDYARSGVRLCGVWDAVSVEVSWIISPSPHEKSSIVALDVFSNAFREHELTTPKEMANNVSGKLRQPFSGSYKSHGVIYLNNAIMHILGCRHNEAEGVSHCFAIASSKPSPRSSRSATSQWRGRAISLYTITQFNSKQGWAYTERRDVTSAFGLMMTRALRKLFLTGYAAFEDLFIRCRTHEPRMSEGTPVGFVCFKWWETCTANFNRFEPRSSVEKSRAASLTHVDALTERISSAVKAYQHGLMIDAARLFSSYPFKLEGVGTDAIGWLMPHMIKNMITR